MASSVKIGDETSCNYIDSEDIYVDSEGCDITSLSDFGTPKTGSKFITHIKEEHSMNEHR